MTETDGLRILLVEDNPGDARLVREMIESFESLDYRFDGGLQSRSEESAVTEGGDLAEPRSADPSVVHVERLSEGLEALERGTVDIVLLDLNLPDSRDLDTIDTVVEHAPTVPIVVLTGMQDREVGLEALDHGAQEYLVKDEINADLLVRTIFHAIQRERYERQLERQHERLATLYKISTIVQDIGGSLIDRSSSESIERTVCNLLAEAEAYRYAWIGEIDKHSETVSMRVGSTPDGFFDDLAHSFTDGDPSGPAARAALREEVQVLQYDDIETDPGREEHATEFGYQSMAAIPIEYEDALYGILVVYSERPGAFQDEERGILGRLGNVVGHAINAIERKTALMSDTSVELELHLPNFLDVRDTHSAGSDAHIDFLTTIPAGDGTFLQYANAEGFTEDGLRSVLEQLPEFEELRLIKEETDRHVVEVRYGNPPIISTLAAHGGQVKSAWLANGDYRVTVELPVDADVRSFVESVRESFPDVGLVAQRSVDSSTVDESTGLGTRAAALTDKQRAALESAYFSGYFQQPRARTGEEIAESLGVTASTFHQHLQAGLRKVLAAEFDGEGDAEAPTRG